MKTAIAKQFLQYKDELVLKESEYEELQAKANHISAGVQLLEVKTNPDLSDENDVAKSSFIAVLFLAIALAAFSGYSYFKNTKQEKQQVLTNTNPKREKVIAHKTNVPLTKKTSQKKRAPAINKRVTDTPIANNKQKNPLRNRYNRLLQIKQNSVR